MYGKLLQCSENRASTGQQHALLNQHNPPTLMLVVDGRCVAGSYALYTSPVTEYHGSLNGSGISAEVPSRLC